MPVREFIEGYYWMRRTAAPFEIGGRSRWIGYYNGHWWEFCGSVGQHTTDEVEKRTEILDRIPDEPLKLYTADFGVYGSAGAIASSITDALPMLKEAHYAAKEIKIERIHEEIEEHVIISGTAFSNLGDT